MIIPGPRNVQIVENGQDSRETPTINRNIACPFMCDESFETAEELIGHIVRNHGDRPDESESSHHEPKAGIIQQYWIIGRNPTQIPVLDSNEVG